MASRLAEVVRELGEGLLVVVGVDASGEDESDGDKLRGVLGHDAAVRTTHLRALGEARLDERLELFKRFRVRLREHAADVRVRGGPARAVGVATALHPLVGLVGNEREERLARRHTLRHRRRLAQDEHPLRQRVRDIPAEATVRGGGHPPRVPGGVPPRRHRPRRDTNGPGTRAIPAMARAR